MTMQNPEWRSRLKKDPGIPNLFPFKDKILQEIEESKRLKAEDDKIISERGLPMMKKEKYDYLESVRTENSKDSKKLHKMYRPIKTKN